MAFGLNIFRTVTADLTTDSDVVYTAPTGYSAIVLMAQISNITANAEVVTMSVLATDSTETELIKDFEIPGNDAASAVTGKLVLETGYSVVAEAGSNGTLKLVLSILESKN